MPALLRLLRHGFCSLRAAVQLAWLFVRASRYFHQYGLQDMPCTAEPRSANGCQTELGGTRARRHRHYFFGAVFLGAVFGHLRGRALDHAEMRRFSILAALASFFDDLTDQTQHLQPPPNSLEDFGHRADPSGMARLLLEKTRAQRPPRHAAAFEEALQRVFWLETTAQRALADTSDRVTRSHPVTPNLAAASAEKGGYSVLLFRLLLPELLAEAERQALLAFGALVQGCDDLFDVWHDRQRGTATAAVRDAERGDLAALSDRFEEQVADVLQTFRQLPISKNRQTSVLCTVGFLVAVARVCLRRYQFLKNKYGVLPLDDRRQMVVDMSQWQMRVQAMTMLLKNTYP